VLGVDKDDFKVFVGGVLVYPVGVQDAQVCTTAADTLLGSGTERALILQLVDSLVGGLTVGSTLRSGPLATSTSDTDTINDIALLSLVPQTTGLIRTRRAGGTVNDIQGPQFPAANTNLFSCVFRSTEHIGNTWRTTLFD
jgi:hypothetical protein